MTRAMAGLVIALGACSSVIHVELRAPPTVTLISAGSGPLQPLRFAPAVGTRRTVDIETRTTIAIDDRAATVALRMPSMFAVTQVAANGDVKFDVTFGKGEAIVDGPGTRPAPKYIGAVEHAVTTDRGIAVRADLVLQDSVDTPTRAYLETTKQKLLETIVALPVEPVGVGAKWTTASRTRVGDVTLEQLATTELVARDGTTVTLATTFERHANHVRVEHADGSVDELVSATGSGHGEETLDLVALVPVHATSTVTTVVVLRTNGKESQLKIDETATGASAAP